MPFTTANNLKLFYDQQGQGEDLILIGGLTTNHTIWDGVLEPLISKYKVLRPDNRGAGQSEVPAVDYTIADMANDVIGLMDHLNIQQAHVVGHSLGGMIVQELLLHHPERIKKAVIYTSFASCPATAALQIETTARLAAANVAEALILETVLPWLFGSEYLSRKNSAQDTIEIMMSNPYPQSAEGYNGQIAAIVKHDTGSRLLRIKNPTLILAGKEDWLTPVYCSEFLYQQIKSSRLEIVEKAGHMIHLEYPEKFVSVIKEFID